jgi:hypothetical protein
VGSTVGPAGVRALRALVAHEAALLLGGGAAAAAERVLSAELLRVAAVLRVHFVAELPARGNDINLVLKSIVAVEESTVLVFHG